MTNDSIQELKIAKEKAEKANKAKSEFLTVMSHELRTPLNGIMGAAQILRARDLTSKQQEYIDDIYQSCNILLSLINDLLDFTKLEEGRLDFTAISFNLKELIHEIGNSLKILAREKGLKFSVQYPNSIPQNIISDPQRISQIIFNLAGNAIKYTKKGAITLSVACTKKTNKNAQFKIYVKDTGFGIPKDKLNFIFDRFAQLESAYKTKYSGSGLGLAIVKQLVESMHGSIHVKSELNRGSTFLCKFKFPLQVKKTQTKIKWPKKYANTRILIVDDEINAESVALKEICATESQIISSNKIINTLITAIDNKRPFDIVILNDNQLPFNKAMEVGKTIIKEMSFNHPQLIILTNQSGKNAQTKKAGFCKCLTKPIKIKGLIKTLVDLLDERKTIVIDDTSTKSPKLKVLLVEDNIINQKVAKIMLTDLGCKVDIAKDGGTALHAVKKKYDIIFMDIGLPDINGYDVTTTIIKGKTKNKNTPIIAMTAHAYKRDNKKCLESGMKTVLTKPISYEQLKDVLDNL